METVRYLGPSQAGHGVYLINFVDNQTTNSVKLEFTLEALIQLRIRIDAALEHLKTH